MTDNRYLSNMINDPSYIHCLDTLNIYLEQGIDIDLRDESGKTLLLIASEFNDISMVGLLLESGANTYISNMNDVTPLMFASRNGNVEIVNLLLDYGANIYMYDIWSYSIRYCP